MAAFWLSVLLAQSAPANVPSAPPPPPGCTALEDRAFDFWVGEWIVYPTGAERQVARSRIEKLYGGCAIRENWMPLNGADGGSLNARDPATGRWRQTWVGSAPGEVRFEGGPVNGAMVLTGYWAGYGRPGKDGLVRMTYTPMGADTVRQFGELSLDHGLTWQSSFDFTYKRAPSAAK